MSGKGHLVGAKCSELKVAANQVSVVLRMRGEAKKALRLL
jgi:hypothetical protein